MKRRCSLALIALLSGCSADIGRDPVPPLAPPTHTPNISQSASVGFTIHWPSRSSKRRILRNGRPRFLSPSTASVIVEVNNTSGPVTFANAPPTGGGSSTIFIDAPVGSDTFTATLYDQPQVAGETSPVGDALGIGNTTLNVQHAVLNTVNIAVAGIVSQIAVTPVSGQPLVESINGVVSLVGDSPETFNATVEDADGNMILPQPPIAVSAEAANTGTGAPSFVAVTPGSSTTSFSVQPIAPVIPINGPAGVDVSSQDANGDTATTSLHLQLLPAIYAGFSNSSNGAPHILLGDDLGNLIPLSTGAFTGVTDPVGLAYDCVNRHVLVAERDGHVLAFDALGNAIAGFSIPVQTGLIGITFDPNSQRIYTLSVNAGATIVS